MGNLVLHKQPTSYKLIIPEKAALKIRYMCSKVPEVEWSGVLFYTYTGTFDKDLIITITDFFPMDIGNKVYTEFQSSPEVVNYMLENDIIDHKIGLIHSHNDMSTFFSGTDLDTLKEEGNDCSNFVSLIVNNAGNYTAAITRKIDSTQKVLASNIYNFFGDKSTPIEKTYTREVTIIEYYMLDITIENSNLDNRIMELRDRNKPKTESKPVINKPDIFGYLSDDDYEADWMLAQLFTGNILATPENVNLEELNNGAINSSFDKRFMSIEEYGLWAESFCDYLMSEYLTACPNKGDSMQMQANMANRIIRRIKPGNEYNNKLIEILKYYGE